MEQGGSLGLTLWPGVLGVLGLCPSQLLEPSHTQPLCTESLQPTLSIPCLLALEECFHLALENKPKTVVPYGCIKVTK